MRLPLILVIALAGAAATAGSAALTWGTADWTDDLRGTLHTSATGSAASPALLPLAAATVAALGAVLAARGWLRQAVSAILALIGLTIGWVGVAGLRHAPLAVLLPPNRSTTPAGSTSISPGGPALAVIGGVLVLVAAAALIIQKTGRSAIGSRYERKPRAIQPGDPDLDLWKALDAHQDPTA